ncbi:hypothetical protein [Symmachiella dynata]|jgi:hypothetical protein|uniref:hypothetical protein n=1 Tax=Symmachiella dynata TaxID=2527995 RepID=UPI0030ED9452
MACWLKDCANDPYLANDPRLRPAKQVVDSLAGKRYADIVVASWLLLDLTLFIGRAEPTSKYGFEVNRSHLGVFCRFHLTGEFSISLPQNPGDQWGVHREKGRNVRYGRWESTDDPQKAIEIIDHALESQLKILNIPPVEEE